MDKMGPEAPKGLSFTVVLANSDTNSMELIPIFVLVSVESRTRLWLDFQVSLFLFGTVLECGYGTIAE